VITVQNLKKSFGDKQVLNELSFSIVPGEIYGLLGPNGSGKTTTINILCNLLDADAGTILVKGNRVSENTKYNIGVVPQEISIYRDLTCKENLNFFSNLYGLNGSNKCKRIQELIQSFQLTPYVNANVINLSGGWQRRVNIAVALVHSPAVLILDEPTAGLDVEARYELWTLIENLRKMGVTILLTTHYLEEAERLCSRIGILHQGRLVAEGSLENLRSLIPAKELAVVDTEEEEDACEKASSLGWEYRNYGGRLTFWLPRKLTLKEFVEAFDNIPLSSVSLLKVGLEHVYIEMTRISDSDHVQ
jgi:ABC-2 type transport system ATP-binding protein